MTVTEMLLKKIGQFAVIEKNTFRGGIEKKNTSRNTSKHFFEKVFESLNIHIS